MELKNINALANSATSVLGSNLSPGVSVQNVGPSPTQGLNKNAQSQSLTIQGSTVYNTGAAQVQEIPSALPAEPMNISGDENVISFESLTEEQQQQLLKQLESAQSKPVCIESSLYHTKYIQLTSIYY